MPRLAHSALAAALFATPLVAEPDPQPNLLEFISPNRIATFVANTAIAALRTQMELEYEYLSTDLTRGSVAISGIIARPQLPYDQARQCVVTIDRAVLNSDVAKTFEIASEMNINLTGAKASAACLPRDVALGLRSAGIREIDLDQFKIRAAYIYTTGETSMDVALAVNEFASLDISASGMIIPRSVSEPAVRVMRSVVSLKDNGGWAKVSAVLPPAFRNPATISEIGTEVVTQALSNDGLRQVTAVERNFVDALMARVEDFVSDPGEITIEAKLPENGILVEPETYSTEPQALIAALALEARVSPIARALILNNDDLVALSDPTNLTPARRLELGRALLDGTGVPQTPALVPEMLEPLVSDPNIGAEAAELIAAALQDSDPTASYRYALIAAAGGVRGAVSLMDRLENQMPTTDVLKAQAENFTALGNSIYVLDAIGDGNDPRHLRALALAHFTGSNATRSYAQAYYFSLLAEAAGDIGASSLKREIEGRFEARGQDVAAAWTDLSAELQARALDDWIGGNLAGRYQTQ